MRLVLEAVSIDSKIEVSDKEIEEKIKELAAAYGRKEEELMANEELKKNIEASIKSEKSVDLILENAKVKEVAPKTEKEEKAEKTEKKTAKKTTTKKSAKKEEDE